MATTYYYTLPGGAFGTRTVDVDDAPVEDLPEGAELITEEEYSELLAAHEEAKEQRLAERQEADLAERRAAYEALIGLGIADPVAQRLSGYVPPPPVDEDDQ
ncbi:hypothetical protein [Streptomyces sp. NPDC086782]|uniref:hypothetical protein n=1 Tax=Streptomyces sp. NPDC086782 TaxID=3365757 RepID=UPI0037F4217A